MGRKALLISENKKLSQVLLPSLKAPPFEIALDQASSVDGAIIEKGGEDPYDLVILDLDPIISDMPGSVRRLREMNPFSRSIIFGMSSALGSLQLRFRAKASGIEVLLTNPPDLEALKGLISQHLGIPYESRLPQSERTEGRAEHTPPPQGEETRGKVLVAEDVAVMANYISDIVSSQGYQVIRAKDGREALLLAKGERPDLVLTDIMMPQMDGLKLLEKLKEDPTTRSIPVVVISSVADRESVLKALKLGASDFIAKPFKPNQLIEKLKNILG